MKEYLPSLGRSLKHQIKKTDPSFYNGLTVIGWSVHSTQFFRWKAIVAYLDGEIVGSTTISKPRHDVQSNIGSKCTPRAGFEIFLDVRLGCRLREIRLFALY